MAELAVQYFDDEFDVDYVEDESPGTPQFEDVLEDEELTDEEHSSPMVLDETKRVIRPRGQAAGTGTQQGIAFWQGSAQTIGTTTAVSPTAKTIPVISTGGAVTTSANPCISAGVPGQELIIIGTDNTKTVTFTDGNGVEFAGGVSPTLALYDTVTLVYYTDRWVETARSNN